MRLSVEFMELQEVKVEIESEEEQESDSSSSSDSEENKILPKDLSPVEDLDITE